MHFEAHSFVKRTLEKAGPGLVLEFGGKDVNGSVRSLFPPTWPYCSIDQEPGPGVNVVADARTFKALVPASVVVCCEVLEHCPTPDRLIANAYDNLAPKGLLILTAAADPREPHSGLDGQQLRFGESYANIAAWQLEEWLRPFHRFEIEQSHPGDIYAWAVKA